MIRKLLLTFALIVTGTILLNAQCIPGIYTSPGVYPDTTTNLPHAVVSVLYNTTLTFVVPFDTTISPYGTIPIDSINFNSITGMPTGFTANPDESGWPGGTSGCVLIAGTAADSMQGKTYPITINTTAHGIYLSFPVTLPLVLTGYRIVVDSASGVLDIYLNKFTLNQNSPNPFSHKTKIEFTSPVVESCRFSVINVIGEEVYSLSINAVAGKNSLEFSASGLPSGIYMYKLSNKTSTITKRMIIEK